MQTRSSDENSVCPSVCLSVKRVHCDKTEERSVRIFAALHGMQTRSSDENYICPSVCLSVKRVHCDKTEERSVQIFYTIRKII